MNSSGGLLDLPEIKPAHSFSFANYQRNSQLAATGRVSFPPTKKTGTTIIGLVYSGGIVLAADTRATNGAIVEDKNCDKIHVIADNIFCCGAGTAGDTQNITRLVSSQLRLRHLDDGEAVRLPRVISVVTQLKQRLFRYGGHIQAALIVGGVDSTGAHLYSIHPHGNTDRLPFITMGSGTLAAMAVLESNYTLNLGKEEAVRIATMAVEAGIYNDLGSGSNVDVTIIEAGGQVTRHRSIVRGSDRPPKFLRYAFPAGTTEILQEAVVESKAESVGILERELIIPQRATRLDEMQQD